MSDDRIVPALCRAALNADDATREGIGSNIDLLILERPNDKTPDEQLERRYQSAVREFQTVLETRDAAAREPIVSVLCRIIATYQKSGKLASARAGSSRCQGRPRPDGGREGRGFPPAPCHEPVYCDPSTWGLRFEPPRKVTIRCSGSRGSVALHSLVDRGAGQSDREPHRVGSIQGPGDLVGQLQRSWHRPVVP